MNYVDTFRANLASGKFDPETASPQDIRTAQLLIGTDTDGIWGNKSQAALEAYQKSYDGPVKFRWAGMEGNDAAQAYSAWDTDRIKAEEKKLAANEQRIEELKQEYLALQQEQENATEDLERNVAANRAGIGDTAQYNSWRARVEAREASKQAREADSKASLAQLRNQVDRAFSDIAWARGDRQTEIARATYKEKLDAYNEAARKAGQPELSENELANKDNITLFDVKDHIRQHRDKNGEWDREENRQKAYEMAKSLGNEGVELLDEIYGQTTKPKADAKRNAYAKAVRTEAAKLKGSKPGNANIVVNGKSIPALVRASSTNPDKYEVVVDGKVVYDWTLED